MFPPGYIKKDKTEIMNVLRINPNKKMNFKTKKALKEHLKGLMNRYVEQYGFEKIGTVNACRIPRKRKCFAFFLDLFHRHPDFIEKTNGNGDDEIKGFAILRNPYFGHLELAYETKLNVFEPFSFNICITKRCPQPKTYLRRAMRFAVSKQIIKFKKAKVKDGSFECSRCGVDDMELHIDHDNPTFETLAAEFMKSKKAPTNYKRIEGSGMIAFDKEDKKLKNEWEAYHKENAVLQVLCVICHGNKTHGRDQKSVAAKIKKSKNENTMSLLEEQGLL